MKRRYFHSDPDELRILGLISTEVYYMMKMKEAALNFDVDEQRRLIHLRMLEQRVEKRNKAEEKQRQEKKKKEQEKAFKEAIEKELPKQVEKELGKQIEKALSK